MSQSFAHRAGGWFYLAWLPLMLAPWLLWPRWWRGMRRELGSESGIRLALLSTGVCLLAFSLISGKRWHYLLPQFLPFALIVARALCDARPTRGSLGVPVLGLVLLGIGTLIAAPRLQAALGGLQAVQALYWSGAATLLCAVLLLAWRPRSATAQVRAIATCTVLGYAALLAGADVAMQQPYDMRAVAGQIARYQADGRPVAIEGAYHGQWHLAGRLQQPLAELPAAEVPDWLARHPQGRVLFIYRDAKEVPPGLRIEVPAQRYRGQQLVILAPP